MNKIGFMCLIVFFINPLFSLGEEASDLEDISGQYAECAAYYELLYHAMMASNEPETAKSYRELYDTAMLYSLVLALESRNKEMAVKVTNSRIEMYIKKMKQEANNKNENISILINKYHFDCQEAMENPSDHLLTVLKKGM